MDKKNRKTSGGSAFLYSLLGALVGGLLVFLLFEGFGSASKSDNNINNNPSQVEDSIDKDDSITNKDKAKENSIADDESMESRVVKKSIDSVVGIATVSQVTQQTWFGKQSGYVEGIGSGSIISSDGYIVTNSHVVSDGDATEINVIFNDGSKTPARLVWNDATFDLAIVKVEKENLPAMELGDSDDIGVGDRVVAIGNPLGLELQSTVTSGIISGLNRTVSFNTGAQIDGLLQTDAAINSGNSGGALLNNKGQQIGINTAKAGNSDGIGFAIPINIVKPIIKQIMQTGEFRSVYLGITGQSLDYLSQFPNSDLGNLEGEQGVYVFSTFAGNNGFKKGDIITAVDGKKVTDMITLKKILLNYQVGESAKISIIRDGKESVINFTFTLDSANVDEYKNARPENQIESDNNDDEPSNPFRSLP